MTLTEPPQGQKEGGGAGKQKQGEGGADVGPVNVVAVGRECLIKHEQQRPAMQREQQLIGGDVAG